MPDDQLPVTSELNSPAAMLTAAIERGIGVEGIKVLAELHERMEAKRAEKACMAAVLAFQAECPAIAKTDEGVHRKKYAPLSKILSAIAPVLHKHGLSYRFNSTLNNNSITSTCTITHAEGHSFDATFSAPVDPSPGMSKTHGGASAVSFSQRYALQQALGVVPGQGDDDGQAGFLDEPITLAQQEVLQKLIDETDSNTPAFWNYIKLPSKELDQLPASRFALAQQALLQKKRTLKK